MVTGNGESIISLWDIETGEIVKTFKKQAQAAYTVKMLGRDIISGGKECLIKRLDALSGEVVATFIGHKSVVSSVAYNQEMCRIVSGSNDKTVRIWDTRRPDKALQCLKGHSQTVCCVVINDTCIYSGSNDKCIKVPSLDNRIDLGFRCRRWRCLTQNCTIISYKRGSL